MRRARLAQQPPAPAGGFADRFAAGLALTEAIERQVDATELADAIVLAMPRGGVPVAAVVARQVALPLSIVLVRKLGAPQQPEYGIGAVTEDGVPWVDAEARVATGVDDVQLEGIVSRELAAIRERRLRYLGGRDWRPALRDRHVLVVDDGLATGVSALAVGEFARRQGARRATLAVPVCACQSVPRMRATYDQVLCVHEPDQLIAVSMWYDDFDPVSDEQVVRVLRSARDPDAGV